MPEKKGSYAGSVPNSGVAEVKAPFAVKSVKKGKVQKGNDLRSTKGK